MTTKPAGERGATALPCPECETPMVSENYITDRCPACGTVVNGPKRARAERERTPNPSDTGSSLGVDITDRLRRLLQYQGLGAQRVTVDAIAEIDRLRAQLTEAERVNESLREWKGAILDLLKTFPAWQEGDWAGNKEGWGFCFEFIKWLHRDHATLTQRVRDLEAAATAGKRTHLRHCPAHPYIAQCICEDDTDA